MSPAKFHALKKNPTANWYWTELLNRGLYPLNPATTTTTVFGKSLTAMTSYMYNCLLLRTDCEPLQPHMDMKALN